jgi:3-carboxy-cis,cis-muconate cycloisomerase
VAEAVMMALAAHTGRGAAHDLVYAACRRVADEGSTLLVHLGRDVEIAKYLSPVQLAALVEPANYLGVAGSMVDRMLGQH